MCKLTNKITYKRRDTVRDLVHKISKYFSSLMTLHTERLNLKKGIRQGLLIAVPILIGYLLGRTDLGLLVATGTLAHIYAIKGTFKSKVQTVLVSAILLSICMFLGTLTVGNQLLFGILLVLISTLVFYVFVSLKIPGPASTFYIVLFALPMNLPVEPSDAFLRSGLVLLGGLVGTGVLVISLLSEKENVERSSVVQNFKFLCEMMSEFNNDSFEALSKKVKDNFKTTERIFITAGAKKSSQKKRLYLLHSIAQGIYAELLELKESGVKEIPESFYNLLQDINENVAKEQYLKSDDTNIINNDETYNDLTKYLFRANDLLAIPKDQVQYEVDMRKPIYSKNLFHNLTLDSYAFISTLRYLIIMSAAITIAFVFKFDQAYWVPLSANTVMIGGTTLKGMERASLRFLGTVVGVILLSIILAFHPNIVIAIIILGLSALIGETLVAANYGFAMTFITIQVILLNGIASQDISLSIALPRITDVFAGVVIAAIGLLIFGRNAASTIINNTIANVVRTESKLFFKLFSKENYQFSEEEKKNISLELSIKINNMHNMYDSAIEELFNDKKKIRHYYSSIYLLDELSFLLERAIHLENRETFDEQLISKYLFLFEDLAYTLETKQPIKIKTDLPILPVYRNIRIVLLKLQNHHLEKEVAN